MSQFEAIYVDRWLQCKGPSKAKVKGLRRERQRSLGGKGPSKANALRRQRPLECKGHSKAKAPFAGTAMRWQRPFEAVLPQPLVQKSFYNLQNSFPPKNFLATKTVEKIKNIQANLRQMYHSKTLREIEHHYIALKLLAWASFSRVPSMKGSAPHICLCSSRGVRCLVMVAAGLNCRRC